MSDDRQAVISDESYIPVLDFGPWHAGEPGALERLAADLLRASETVGFYFIRNHGIPQAMIDATFAECARFHALPLAEKLALRMDHHMTGYLPMGDSEVNTVDGQQDDDRPRADLNAALFVRRDRGPDHPDVVSGKLWRAMNRWPAGLPGFRETVMTYWNRMERFGQELLTVLEVALGLPAGFFAPHFVDAHINLRMAHYPPVTRHLANQYGIAPHTDAGFVTLLPQTGAPGLEIRTRSHRWLAVPPLPGTFLVNTGDTLNRWSNGRLLSTVHRASNPHPDRDRYAIPFFYDPNTDAVIECLPTCQGPGNPPHYPTQTYGDYYAYFIRRNYRHTREAAA